MEIEFKKMAEQKFKQSDSFQKEILDFKKEMLDFKKTAEQKFEHSDAFEKDMLDFKKEMLDFKKTAEQRFEHNDAFEKDMLEFKDNTTKTLAKLTQAVTNLSKTVNEIHEHLILMETQLNDKVAILFDDHITNSEQHEDFNHKFENLDNITTRHSFRISSLEDKVNLHSK